MANQVEQRPTNLIENVQESGTSSEKFLVNWILHLEDQASALTPKSIKVLGTTLFTAFVVGVSGVFLAFCFELGQWIIR